MTDRHAGYVVTLTEDVREDDAEATIAAIQQIKGVMSVTPIDADPALIVARARARGEIYTRLQRVVDGWL